MFLHFADCPQCFTAVDESDISALMRLGNVDEAFIAIMDIDEVVAAGDSVEFPAETLQQVA